MGSMKVFIVVPDFRRDHKEVCFFIVARTLQYNIIKSGYQCRIVPNSTETDRLRATLDRAVVIVFTPWIDCIRDINCRVILYNSESLKSPVFGKKARECIRDPRVFQIWDYCYNNALLSRSTKKHIMMPIGYSPNNDFPIRQHKKMFDIILYGTHLGTHPGDTRFKRREAILNAINQRPSIFDNYNSDCLDIEFYTGYYKDLNGMSEKKARRHWLKWGQHENRQCCGKSSRLKNFWITQFASLEQKLEYIGASKIVLIIHTYECDKPIDYFRIVELIKNKCFFIMEKPQDSESVLYERYRDYIVFSEYDKILDTCLVYLNKTQEERNMAAERLYRFWMQAEDYSSRVKGALGQVPFI